MLHFKALWSRNILRDALVSRITLFQSAPFAFLSLEIPPQPPPSPPTCMVAFCHQKELAQQAVSLRKKFEERFREI